MRSQRNRYQMKNRKKIHRKKLKNMKINNKTERVQTMVIIDAH